jgi:hypothetical protein
MRIAAVPLLAVLALACASVAARSPESMLEAAGFKTIAANTPERIQVLKTLPPKKVSPVDRNGETFYVYPDPDGCRCLRVGRQEQYDMYQRLVAGKQATTLDRTRTSSNENVLKGFDK